MTPDPLPAPALREVAEIWWDVERDPVLAWTADGRGLDLIDPREPANRLLVARFSQPPEDPEAVAVTLAQGLAACDFPPNGDGAEPEHVRRALVAGGQDVRLA